MKKKSGSNKINNPIKIQQDSKSTTIRISPSKELVENVNEQLLEFYNSLTDEQKAKLVESQKEHQMTVDSIKECESKDEKKELFNEYEKIRDRLKAHHSTYDISNHEKEDIDLLYSIELEEDAFWDALNEFRKNKIDLRDLYLAIYDITENLEDELQEDNIPDQVRKYCEMIIDEFKQIQKQIADRN